MTDVVVIGIINALATVTTTILTITVKARLDRVHKQIDGKMTELLDLTAKSSKAEGVLEEKEKTE